MAATLEEMMKYSGHVPGRLSTYGKHPGDMLFDFMRMNVRELEVIWEDVYIDLISARSTLKQAINLRGCPVRVRTSGTKLYLVRRDM